MPERTCSRCGHLAAEDRECPACAEWFETRPDAAAMTPDERVAEFESWRVCEIDFNKIHRRIEELVGRPVWTHEIGLNRAGLREEARVRTGELPTVEKLVEGIPAENLVIVSTEKQ